MCPADFTATGEQLLCSSLIGSGEQRHSGCSPEGTCQCLPPYSKPVQTPSNTLLCIMREGWIRTEVAGRRVRMTLGTHLLLGVADVGYQALCRQAFVRAHFALPGLLSGGSNQ